MALRIQSRLLEDGEIEEKILKRKISRGTSQFGTFSTMAEGKDYV
jgi:hypothetical protein